MNLVLRHSGGILNPRVVEDYSPPMSEGNRQQGVDLNRYIEVIVRQMMRKIKVEGFAGDTDLLPGAMLTILELEDANEKVQERIDAGETGLTFATASPVLMGITKAALATESSCSLHPSGDHSVSLTDDAIMRKADPPTRVHGRRTF